MKTRVLVAEANDDCRALLRIMLIHLGCTVVEASDGLDGIEKAVTTHPDLIIMDLRMPKVGGLEVIRRLKKIPSTRDIPIVICTAMGREAFGYANVLDHLIEVLQKPIQLQKIREIVRKYVPQEKQQQTQFTVQKKEPTNVLGAWRLLQNIKHAISEVSLRVEFPKVHNFDDSAKAGRPTRKTKAAIRRRGCC
jgi:twitching motility two-component system response regulator PilH